MREVRGDLRWAVDLLIPIWDIDGGASVGWPDVCVVCCAPATTSWTFETEVTTVAVTGFKRREYTTTPVDYPIPYCRDHGNQVFEWDATDVRKRLHAGSYRAVVGVDLIGSPAFPTFRFLNQEYAGRFEQANDRWVRRWPDAPSEQPQVVGGSAHMIRRGSGKSRITAMQSRDKSASPPAPSAVLTCVLCGKESPVGEQLSRDEITSKYGLRVDKWVAGYPCRECSAFFCSEEKERLGGTQKYFNELACPKCNTPAAFPKAYTCATDVSPVPQGGVDELEHFVRSTLAFDDSTSVEQEQRRIEAVQAIGRAGGPAAVSALIRLLEVDTGYLPPLTATKSTMRDAVIAQLGMAHDPAATEPLVAAVSSEGQRYREAMDTERNSKIRDSDPDFYKKAALAEHLATAAVLALGAVGDPRAVPALTEVAANKQLPRSNRKAAKKALGLISSNGA